MKSTIDHDYLQELLFRCQYPSLVPFLRSLNEHIDVRLVRTANTLLDFICCAHDKKLLLTDIADELSDTATSCESWVKRLERFLGSDKWTAELVDLQLFAQANELVDEAGFEQRDCLCLWDDSVWEKPETLACEDFCAVRSAKAKRINRVKPGFFSPPKGFTNVPGMNLSCSVIATSKKSRIAQCRFWSSRDDESLQLEQTPQSFDGEQLGNLRSVQLQMLEQAHEQWGNKVLHVFDRGYSGAPWLGELLKRHCRFIVRWQSQHKLKVSRKHQFAHHCVTGLKRKHIYVHDAHKRKKTRCYVVWRQVKHPKFLQQKLTLLVCSDKKRSPWYLLTNEPVEDIEDARRIIQSYARRWEIEQTFRRNKTSLRSETIQLRKKDRREKLFKLTLLAQNALMMLNEQKELVWALLEKYCKRRGSRLREKIKVPFDRLRKALWKMFQLSRHRKQATLDNVQGRLIFHLSLPP